MASKKLNLKGLKEKYCKSPRNRIPNGIPVSCYECGWFGVIEDCPVEMESDGWEFPSYEICVCPECGGDIDL